MLRRLSYSTQHRYHILSNPEIALTFWTWSLTLHCVRQTLEEIAFVPELRRMAALHPDKFTLQLYVSNELDGGNKPQIEDLRYTRIERSDINEAMQLATKDEHRWPSFYVCGPPAMIDSIQQLALDVGLPLNDLQIERW